MNTGSEGTGIWLGAGAGCAGLSGVVSIATTSGVCDSSYMER